MPLSSARSGGIPPSRAISSWISALASFDAFAGLSSFASALAADVFAFPLCSSASSNGTTPAS